MLNSKLISSKIIIWEIYRDLGTQEGELNYSDFIEWIVDCLNFIYHPSQYERKITGYKDNSDLDILNYKVALPCDLVQLVAVTVDGFQALPTNNSFHQLKDGSCCGVDQFGSLIPAGTFVDNFGNTFVTNLGTKYGSAPLTYELNNGWLTLSVKTGKVCLAYLAMPVDCDGFPLVPDDQSYKEMVKRYIIMKLDYIKYRQNPSDSGLRQLYEHSSKEYEWYCGQASNKAKMPSVDQTENMKRMLLRLKPNINSWNSNFSTLSTPEGRRIK